MATRTPIIQTPQAPPLETTAFDELGGSFRGELLLPTSPGYDTARRIWNGAIDRHPACIARCTGVADVVAAVRFARDHDLEIAVRGGGHNVAGTAVCDDGVVIDLAGDLRAVRVDPAGAHRLRAAGGTLCGRRSTTRRRRHGLATAGRHRGDHEPASPGSPSAAATRGCLTRKHGLAADNLLCRRRGHRRRAASSRASADEHPTRSSSGRCAAPAATSASSPRSGSLCIPSARP